MKFKLSLVTLLLVAFLSMQAQSIMDRFKQFKDGHWGFGMGLGFNYLDGDLKPDLPGMAKSILTSPSGFFEMEYSFNDLLSGGIGLDLMYLNESDENETTTIFTQHLVPYLNFDLLTLIQGRKNPNWNINATLGVGIGATLDSYYRQTQVYPDPNNMPAILDPSYISENARGTMIRDKDAAYAVIRPGLGIDYKLNPSNLLGLRINLNYTNSDKLETVPRSSQNDFIESLQFAYKFLILNDKGKHASEVATFEPVAKNCCDDLDAYRDQLKAMSDKLDKINQEKKVLNDRVEKLENEPKSSGILDSDNDGVVDQLDKCPQVAGPVSNNGCPELTQADKKVFAQAMKGVQFELNSAILRQISLPILDNVVKVMTENPEYKLKINGHTSSDGDMARNQTLSEERAKSVMDYLISKGISTDRLEYHGYGQTQPIADNSTAVGRVTNRRVEFQVFF